MGPSLELHFWGSPLLKSASAQEVLEAEVKTCEPPAEFVTEEWLLQMVGFGYMDRWLMRLKEDTFFFQTLNL